METQESQTPDGTGTSDSSLSETPIDTSAQVDGGSDGDAGNVDVGSPDFQEVSDDRGSATPAPSSELNRFQDIKVVVSADLGRATVPIQTLMNLGEGSVLELNREIDSPIELVAQGVPLASGEVVDVNGCFAVRITKVYENQKN